MITLLYILLMTEPAAIIPSCIITPEGIAGITRNTVREDLAVLGEENIEDTREHLGEGYYSDGTLIGGGTENEMVVIWEEGIISQIRIQGSGPRTAEGIGLGSRLTELEAVIGEFQMAGFAWDAEGWVDLQGTVYEGLYIRMVPDTPLPERFMGDGLFSSSELREYNPAITDMRVLF